VRFRKRNEEEVGGGGEDLFLSFLAGALDEELVGDVGDEEV